MRVFKFIKRKGAEILKNWLKDKEYSNFRHRDLEFLIDVAVKSVINFHSVTLASYSQIYVQHFSCILVNTPMIRHMF